jgi:hypothetical protein
MEAVQERILRRNDWKRIALTERQRLDDESDEHYFWKALVAEGIVRGMKQQFDQRQPEGETNFDAFLQEEILAEELLLTEHTVDKHDDQKRIVADLYVPIDESPSWVSEAVTEFFGEEITGEIAVEVETGRSEGAFNFRKMRETVDKYAETGTKQHHICVVLPSRLLYRGERRARMILELVESWNELQREQDSTLSAKIYVPIIKDGYCQELQAGIKIVDELYREEEE